MTRDLIIRKVKDAIKILKRRAPYDTGNLAYNAIKYRIEGKNLVIYVDEEVAPYMACTNERWVNRPGKNPNEKWWQEAIEFIIKYLAQELKGDLNV